jgi:hypothetical protein
LVYHAHDACLERHDIERTSGAFAEEADVEISVRVHVDEFDVSAVSMQVVADRVQHCADPGTGFIDICESFFLHDNQSNTAKTAEHTDTNTLAAEGTRMSLLEPKPAVSGIPETMDDLRTVEAPGLS